MARFGRPRTHPSIYRRYTLDEMISTFCRLTADAPPYDFAKCREIAMKWYYPYPVWERCRVPVADIPTICLEPSCLPKYVDRRRRGGRFPPVILTPVENPPYEAEHGDVFPRDAEIYVQEGHHRVRAAQIAGDEWIDAFVPVRPRST